ncbi:hypothetical protein Tco_1077501 [Tanacetum coccineum]
MHLTAVIPYLRSTKIIVDRFMTENPNIPKRLHEHYHRVANDEIIKSIFNSGKNKERYVSVFEVDVPMTQSQLIESTQETHKTPSSPRPPNLVEHQGESSAPRKSTIIQIPIRRKSDSETLIPTSDEIDVTNLDEATQVSIATARSLEDLKAQENIETVGEHLVDEDIENIVEGGDNVDEDEFLDESLIAKRISALESVEDALIRKKGKGIVEIKDAPTPTPIRSYRTHTDPLSSDKEKL